jgi:hypothetical protein
LTTTVFCAPGYGHVEVVQILQVAIDAILDPIDVFEL